MRDYFLDTLFSLGEACVKGEETLIRSCIYIKRSSQFCQPSKRYPLVPIHISVVISKKSTSK
ncbi:hypothetical protein SSM2_251 [Synechococcus phage S-SM2]|uniref:Uncharacterized protein n=1 Tax=Synechococcus phage S-SM2 TaxID=444860 RepID=E3SJD6_9CAUD|nr:hypothetical protein SSM2_251 [Synechococcus phage S-SM2]ADO97584.1 hypothetical protein SSM2_251 [Synechococcus phage S-SM2]